MSNILIPIRNLSTINHVKQILHEIYNNIDSDELILDFNPLAFVKIIPASILAREIRSLTIYRRKKNLNTKAILSANTDPIHYLRYIGYYRFLRLDAGNDMRNDCRTSNHIPVTEYSYSHFKELADKDLMGTVQCYIAKEADELSKLFSMQGNKNEIISYALKEMIRNVFEHSKSDKLYIMGQYWQSGNVQIAIMDEGVGLLKTLQEKYPSLLNDNDAIFAALKPGVSGSNFLDNPNENSGFGLYVISSIAKQLGYFFICSGTSGVKLSHNTSDEHINLLSSGTLVCIHIDKLPSDYKEEFQKIIDDGNHEARQGAYPITASKHTSSFLE